MVIEEKALIRALKESWKGDGYTVARVGSGEDGILVLQARDWGAEITWANVPSKVLGLIVEHLKDLPGDGQAFTVSKSEEAASIFDMVERLPDPAKDEGTQVIAHFTGLSYMGAEVWQKDEGKRCFLVPAEKAAMMLYYGRTVRWLNRGLYLEGKASKLYVMPRFLMKQSREKDAMKFLSGNWWE